MKKMKKIALVFGLLVVLPAFADSFLKAQSFPKTFQDLSFTSRMEFKTEDYELYQPEYDENGYCIKNCAYHGLHITRELEISDQDTQQALQNSEAVQNQNNPIQNLPVDTQHIVSAISSSTQTSAPTCANRNPEIPIGQKAPFGKPVKGNPRISSPYGPRVLHGKKSFHDGIDFAVVTGTDVYSPADAVVVKVINDNRCGKGLRLQHNDGTQSIYCHLSQQLVSVGQSVSAGCQIAKSGNTGHSTGPHLHYGLRNSAGSKIDPTPYINK